MKENWLFLLLSVSLSSGRNVITKKTAADAEDRRWFFLSQAVLFAAAAVLLLFFSLGDLQGISALTVSYSFVYGILLVLSQWMLTAALKSGGTAVCTVVYSLGFLLPTISGVLFWREPFSLLHFVGVLLAVAVILLTANTTKQETRQSKSFLPLLLVAMTASGGLGILQKLQQSSLAADERGAFLLLAFFLAFAISMAAFLCCHGKVAAGAAKLLSPAAAGLCFGGANLCNTLLAGRMKSAVFFPLQNVSTIVLSTLLGVALFRETIQKRTAAILLLGIAVIVLFSL